MLLLSLPIRWLHVLQSLVPLLARSRVLPPQSGLLPPGAGILSVQPHHFACIRLSGMLRDLGVEAQGACSVNGPLHQTTSFDLQSSEQMENYGRFVRFFLQI